MEWEGVKLGKVDAYLHHQMQTAGQEGLSHQTDCMMGPESACKERRAQLTEMKVKLLYAQFQLRTRVNKRKTIITPHLFNKNTFF